MKAFLIICVAFSIMFTVLFVGKLKSMRHTKQTPDQTLERLRVVESELADVKQMLAEVKSQRNISSTQPESPAISDQNWITLFDGQLHILNGPSGKPILMGLCPDGIVRWKLQ